MTWGARRANIHVVKPGRDYYLWLFVVELFAALYILCFFEQMASTAQSSVTSSVQKNMLSGDMVLALFAQVRRRGPVGRWNVPERGVRGSDHYYCPGSRGLRETLIAKQTAAAIRV